MGICILNTNIYTSTECRDFWVDCREAIPVIQECQNLEDSDVWVSWDGGIMGDGIWVILKK